MAELEVKVPPVGESITEVTIGNWVKNDGDEVKMDEVICGLDSDKATFELTAEADGILRIKAQEGDTLAIGDLLAVIELNASTGEAAPKEDSPAPSVSEPAPAAASAASEPARIIDMKVPTVGESITEVTIASWSKNDGDFVELDEILCELESDKATFELPAEASGILRISAEAGETLGIGEVICRIEVSSNAPAKAAPAAAPQPANDTSAPADKKGYAEGHPSPVASKILAEKGIDPKEVSGTGVGGRITKADATNAEKKSAPAATPSAPAKTAPAEPASEGNRVQRREKMSSLRRTIARRLVAVKNETAMLTTFNEVDMKPIMDLRAKFKDQFKEKHEVGLGFMSFFTKAVCVALRDYPGVNAYIDGDEIIYNDFCDVSIAVSSPRGLVVPVIRNAEQLSFAQVEKEVVRLAVRARDGKLGIDEMTGGTFTITNGGIFGSMLSTPIINAPQSAILGMHNIVERAVVVKGEIVIRPIMYVALSYDHRIIDGKDSVSFLVRVKQLLEDPTRLLLDI